MNDVWSVLWQAFILITHISFFFYFLLLLSYHWVRVHTHHSFIHTISSPRCFGLLCFAFFNLVCLSFFLPSSSYSFLLSFIRTHHVVALLQLFTWRIHKVPETVSCIANKQNKQTKHRIELKLCAYFVLKMMMIGDGDDNSIQK